MILLGKTAIVTGASRGIGRAICQKLSALGANVVVNYAGNQTEAEKTRALCASAVLARGDVSDEAACKSVFETCVQAFGPPDILINNAGITRDGLLLRMSGDDFARVLDTNLKGAFYMSKLVLRAMLKGKWGRIVNIASVVGLSGNAGQVNYAASKAALIGFSKSAAKEYATSGITVNAVAPGFIETDMTAVLPETVKAAMLQNIPMARFGGAGDVAAAVAFFCLPESGYITGQVVCVDGGMNM